jgi:hypothetical protein
MWPLGVTSAFIRRFADASADKLSSARRVCAETIRLPYLRILRNLTRWRMAAQPFGAHI